MPEFARKRRREESVFCVGQRVRVHLPGHTFDTWCNTARQLKLDKWHRFETPFALDVGTIVSTNVDKYRGDDVVAIHVARHDKQYLIACSALSPMEDEDDPGNPAVSTSSSHPMRVLEDLWSSRDSTGDTHLVASDGRHLVVHGCVLAVASPVFEQTFIQESKLAMENKVKIMCADTNYDTIAAAVEVLYTGSYYGHVEHDLLLKFADRYQVKLLSDIIGPVSTSSRAIAGSQPGASERRAAGGDASTS